jgi:hypothetical protein
MQPQLSQRKTAIDLAACRPTRSLSPTETASP